MSMGAHSLFNFVSVCLVGSKIFGKYSFLTLLNHSFCITRRTGGEYFVLNSFKNSTSIDIDGRQIRHFSEFFSYFNTLIYNRPLFNNIFLYNY